MWLLYVPIYSPTSKTLHTILPLLDVLIYFIMRFVIALFN